MSASAGTGRFVPCSCLPVDRGITLDGEVQDRRIRVLVVDDDPFIIKVIRVMLGVNDIEVYEALGGIQGCEAAKVVVPDVVLLDIMMPDIDGFEVCRRLKEDEATRDIPIIFVSAVTAPEQMKKGLSLGAQGYITKPFKPEVIVDKIVEVVQRDWERKNA